MLRSGKQIDWLQSKKGFLSMVLVLKSGFILFPLTYILSVPANQLFRHHIWLLCLLLLPNSTCVIEESFGYLDAPVERIAGADVPMPYAANLERMAVPQVDSLPILIIWFLLQASNAFWFILLNLEIYVLNPTMHSYGDRCNNYMDTWFYDLRIHPLNRFRGRFYKS